MRKLRVPVVLIVVALGACDRGHTECTTFCAPARDDAGVPDDATSDASAEGCNVDPDPTLAAACPPGCEEQYGEGCFS